MTKGELMKSDIVSIQPCGDSAIIISFKNEIDPSVNQDVRCLMHMIEKERPFEYTDMIPGYCTLYIDYVPGQVTYQRICHLIKALSLHAHEVALPPHTLHEIPTVYGGEGGPDLKDVASINGLSIEEVVKLHCEGLYYVYMLGFAPGFPYLGGLNPKIAAPRLEKPRLAVPRGSVGIAGMQTGIYPIKSPGGWRIIGRTSIPLFSPEKSEPILFKAGDFLKFKAIDII